MSVVVINHRCTHRSCVPSQLLIYQSRLAQTLSNDCTMICQMPQNQSYSCGTEDVSNSNESDQSQPFRNHCVSLIAETNELMVTEGKADQESYKAIHEQGSLGDYTLRF